MKLHTSTRRTFGRVGAIAALAVAFTLPLAGQTPKPANSLPQGAVISMAAALGRLLPASPGWTKVRASSDRIELSDSCAYSYADAVYTNGAMKVRVTLADTAGDPAALAVLATMVVTLPDNYSATIDGAASVSRVTFKGSPAAMRWDPVKLDGEFVVIVGGRFVAKAEGTGIDSIEALRGFVEQVDLKALAELK